MGTIINEASVSIDTSESIEKNKKDEEYMNYINNHVKNVQESYLKFFIPLLDIDKTNISTKISDFDLKNAIIEAKSNIETHDASKYSEEEFDGYRAKWYPTTSESNNDELQKIIDEKSEQSWVHHYRNNPHHPEYWNDPLVVTTPDRDMSLSSVIEMISDWLGMSKGNLDNLKKWYEKEGKKDKEKVLTEHTKEIVEEIIYNILY